MNEPLKVVVTDFVTDALEPEQNILGSLARAVALDCFSEDELVGKIEDADAIMLYHVMELTRKTIERLQRCKLIVRCGVGYDNIDFVLAASAESPSPTFPTTAPKRSPTRRSA